MSLAIYLFGPSHDIQALTAPQNTVAMYETALATALGLAGQLDM